MPTFQLGLLIICRTKSHPSPPNISPCRKVFLDSSPILLFLASHFFMRQIHIPLQAAAGIIRAIPVSMLTSLPPTNEGMPLSPSVPSLAVSLLWFWVGGDTRHTRDVKKVVIDACAIRSDWIVGMVRRITSDLLARDLRVSDRMVFDVTRSTLPRIV